MHFGEKCEGQRDGGVKYFEVLYAASIGEARPNVEIACHVGADPVLFC